MTTIVIPSGDWTKHLVDAIEQYQPGDVIIVDTEAKKALADRAAGRMGKAIQVQVGEGDKAE